MFPIAASLDWVSAHLYWYCECQACSSPKGILSKLMVSVESLPFNFVQITQGPQGEERGEVEEQMCYDSNFPGQIDHCVG